MLCKIPQANINISLFMFEIMLNVKPSYKIVLFLVLHFACNICHLGVGATGGFSHPILGWSYLWNCLDLTFHGLGCIPYNMPL